MITEPSIENYFVDFDKVILAIPPSQYMARALVELLRAYEPQMEIDLKWVQPTGEPLPVANAATVVARLSEILGALHPAVLDVKHSLRELLWR
jgi:hypothetical protein